MNSQLQILGSTTLPPEILSVDSLQRPIDIRTGGLHFVRIAESSSTSDGKSNVIYRWLVTEISAVEGTGKNLASIPTIQIASKTASDRAVNSVPVLDNDGNVTSISVIDGGFKTNTDGSILPEYGFDGLGEQIIGNTTYRGFQFPNDFTVTVSQVKFRNTQDDDSDLVDAAIKSAGALVAFDVARCGLDAGLDLINTGFDNLKKSLSSAVNQSGVDSLLADLNKLTQDFADKLPKAPEFPSFADQLSQLDLSDPAAIAAFKEKWGDIVPDLDSILGGEIDLCSVAKQNIQAEVQPDGSYKKRVVATPPKQPTAQPPKSIRTTDTILPDYKEETSQTPFEIMYGVNSKDAAAAYRRFQTAWQGVNHSLLTPYTGEYASARDAMANLKFDQKYNLFRQLSAEKKLDTDSRLSLAERNFYHETEQTNNTIIAQFRFRKKKILKAKIQLDKFIRNNAKALAGMNENIFSQYIVDIGENKITKLTVEESLIGHNIFGSTAVYPLEAFEDLVLFTTAINNEIKKSIWNDIEFIRALAYYNISRQNEGTYVS